MENRWARSRLASGCGSPLGSLSPPDEIGMNESIRALGAYCHPKLGQGNIRFCRESVRS
jgi:hypothetical protein